MRIHEATEKLEQVRYDGPGIDIWRTKVTAILEAVWTEAYEEGLEKTFEGPAVTGE